MDKVASVTEASSGLGRQTFINLSNSGYHVCLTGRNQSELLKTVSMAN